MAYPTAVNNQITDSVTQANVKVLGDAPAMALSMLYQATAQALGNAAHNATRPNSKPTFWLSPSPLCASRLCWELRLKSP